MNGLEKIIDHILADAKERARVILGEAGEECHRIAEEYAALAERTKEEIATAAEEEGARLITTARSEALKNHRNILLEARNATIDRAFARAAAELRATEYGKYREVLTALLTSALIDAAAAEDRSRALGDEVEEFSHYEVLMNAADREEYGKSVVDSAQRRVERRIGAARAAKIRLAEETAEIDGGVILRFGDVEINCSLSMILAEIRGELEGKVAAALFPQETK